jgi:hypothetical protein
VVSFGFSGQLPPNLYISSTRLPKQPTFRLAYVIMRGDTCFCWGLEALLT